MNGIRMTGNPSGRDRYAEKYRDELELQAQWLAFGAVEKATSIERLLERQAFRPHRLIELGCGTGAVLAECQRRDLADEYAGLDYSDDAIRYLRAHVPGVIAHAADLMSDSITLDGPFDAIVLSHVLEHLEEPRRLLESLRGRLEFTYLIAEVPLEDLPLLRLRSRLFGRPGIRAGHVQFYTQRSFEQLLMASGFEIVDRRTYLPVPTKESLALVEKRESAPGHVRLRRQAGRHLQRLLRPIWMRLYYAHHACLCVPRRT